MDESIPAPLAEETDADRCTRIAWKAAGIAEADAKLAAGLYVDVADMRACVGGLPADAPLPRQSGALTLI
jgi:hypothetical protein